MSVIMSCWENVMSAYMAAARKIHLGSLETSGLKAERPQKNRRVKPHGAGLHSPELT